MGSSSQTASKSPALHWKYDVFLSFRGPDTRKGITSELYYQLQKKGIKTFMDEQDLEVGDVISPTLLRAIEDSRFAIVVLSQNYASSTWCLEELTKILQWMEDDKRIFPLFYHVDPTDVRYQKRSFQDAFMKHGNSGQCGNKKQQWRDALNKVANFSGWHTLNYNTERQLVEAIVGYVCIKVRSIEIESTEDHEVFEATRQAEVKVMNALTNDKVTAIGVYGMGGVGKTTLVKYIGQQALDRGLFEHVVMVVMSQSPEVGKIQGTLADRLGLKLEKGTVEGRADELKAYILLRRSKILIILDDIWEILNLSSIGLPCYKELQNCSSKVLLTTRRLNVCHVMRCQEKITLDTLSENDSWTLFLRNARLSFESTTFEDVARKVARECCGLPIALIAVARALGDKDLVEWQRACQRLEKSQTANPDDTGVVFECIKLSYDYLKNENHKLCFLLCCLFPEDFDIPVQDLFQYGYGIGLFRDADTIQEARGTAESTIIHLKSSSLLMDGENNGCVRMHDVIRDTAIQIAQDWFFVRVGQNLGYGWPRGLREDYIAVSLQRNNIYRLPRQVVFPNLQILLLNYNQFSEIPETFLQSLNELRVLDLSGNRIYLLPKSLNLLTNLQTLNLDYCNLLDDISIVGKLKKLEILSMKYSVLKELQREIGDLTNLRIFDITGAKIPRIPSKVISKLLRLEELCMRCQFWDRRSNEGQESNFSFEEITRLANLRVLKVCISHAECIPKAVEFDPNWVEFDITVGTNVPSEMRLRSPSSRMLEIISPSTVPDWFFNVVISKAERIEWTWNLRLIDIFVECHLGRFYGLKHLNIHNIGILSDTTRPWEDLARYRHMGSEGGYRPHIWPAAAELPKDPVLENLEELHLCDLGSLEELCLGELPHGSLFNLKVLEVTLCDNWGNVLLPEKLLRRLPNMEKLIGSCMNRIEYVFGCKNFQSKESKLREMELYSLYTVKSICDGPAPLVLFKNLERMSIWKCNIRGSLFTCNVAQCLFHLEEVVLKNCSFLQRIVEASDKKIILPKLKILKLQSLPELCYGITTIDFECPLEKLDVHDCPQFSVSISDFYSRSSLPELDKSL